MTDGRQVQSEGGVVLTQVHQLSVADGRSVQTIDGVALTQTHSLAVNDGRSAQTADAPALTQVHNLSVADGQQAQSEDVPTLVLLLGTIININHETGDLSQYTNTVTDSSDLSVTAPAALAGTSYGAYRF